MKADTKLTVVMCFWILTRGLHSHLAAISGGGCAAQGLWTEHQSAGELLVLQPVYVLVWEPVSKQKILCVLSPKQCFKIRNLFLSYKDTFIYHINLEDLKKQNLMGFLCVFLKIWLWKEAKIS